MENTIKRFHNFLNKSLVAKLVVYALALVLPFVNGLLYLEQLGINPYDISIFTLNPYYFNWIGFYSCVLLIWTYYKKSPTLVTTIVMLNLLPTGFWCFFAFIGGWAGVLTALSTFTIPFPMILLVDNLMLRKIVIFVGVFILASILILGIRAFLRTIAEGETNLSK